MMNLRTSLLVALSWLVMTGCGGDVSPMMASVRDESVTAVIVKGATRLNANAYAPSPLEVAAGTTVTWINEDDTIHTSTSNAGVWGSPALTPGARYSFTFQSAGTFTYRCAVHPNMIGIVTVQ